MSDFYWERDPYTKGFDVNDKIPAKERGPSEAHRRVIRDLCHTARNEGVDLYSSPDYKDEEFSPCESTGGIHYNYDPIRLKIYVRGDLPWPQYRWNLAVAVGCHFTRHHFFERDSKAEWRKHAELWATSYLASTVSWIAIHHLPNNTPPDEEESKTAPPPPPSKSKLDRRAAKRKNRCHGHTPDGEPCLSPAKRGTAFCCHHQ